MPKAISMHEVMQACERRQQFLRRKLSAHIISTYEFHRRLYGLELAYELAAQLSMQGFDEVFVREEGETLKYSFGWLPLHGSDLVKYLRALKAAGVHRAYIREAGNTYFPSPSIYLIEDEIYVEWPEWINLGYPSVYIRLDDAGLGDRFTSGMEIFELDSVSRERLARRLRGRRELAKTVHMIGVHDYLKIAGKVCGYALRLYDETGFPIQMLKPYVNTANTMYLLETVWTDELLATMIIGVPLGYFKPYDPRYGLVLAPPRLLYATPRLFELEDEDLLKTLTMIAGSGTKIYQGEGGSGLYLLDTPRSERALRRAFGRQSVQPLSSIILPRLGTGLYLYIEAGDGAGLYEVDMPPPEYVATIFASRALYLDGNILKPRVEGLPNHLLSLFSGKLTISGRTTKYHIATAQKKIDLSGDGTYYDEVCGVGVAV